MGSCDGHLLFVRAVETIIQHNLVVPPHLLEMPPDSSLVTQDDTTVSPVAQDLQCSTCGKHMSSHSGLVKHMSKAHKTQLSGDVTFSCHLCQHAFTTRAVLKRHMIRSHKAHLHPNFQHSCKFCAEKISERADMDAHMRRAHPDRLHEFRHCALCSGLFSTNASLFRHFKRQHNSDPNIKQLSCYLCGQSFYSNNQVTYHLRHAHKMKSKKSRRNKKGEIIDQEKIAKHRMKKQKRKDREQYSSELPPSKKFRKAIRKTVTNASSREQLSAAPEMDDDGSALLTNLCEAVHDDPTAPEDAIETQHHTDGSPNPGQQKVNIKEEEEVEAPARFPSENSLEDHNTSFSENDASDDTTDSSDDSHQSEVPKEDDDTKLNVTSKKKHIKVQCEICSKVYSNQYSLNVHLNKIHGRPMEPKVKIPTVFKCEICERTFRTCKMRLTHYRTVHGTEMQRRCGLCRLEFSSHEEWLSHRSTAHVFTCELCGKVLKNRDSHREHMMIHEGPRLPCPHCSKTFVQHSNLKRHIRTHTGEKPFPCNTCGRRFSDPSACKNHAAVHRPNHVRHVCALCGVTFRKRQNLTYHMRLHAGRGLLCPLCPYVGAVDYSFQEHLKVHKNHVERAMWEVGLHRYFARHPSLLLDCLKATSDGIQREVTRMADERQRQLAASDYDTADEAPAPSDETSLIAIYNSYRAERRSRGLASAGLAGHQVVASSGACDAGEASSAGLVASSLLRNAAESEDSSVDGADLDNSFVDGSFTVQEKLPVSDYKRRIENSILDGGGILQGSQLVKRQRLSQYNRMNIDPAAIENLICMFLKRARDLEADDGKGEQKMVDACLEVVLRDKQVVKVKEEEQDYDVEFDTDNEMEKLDQSQSPGVAIKSENMSATEQVGDSVEIDCSPNYSLNKGKLAVTTACSSANMLSGLYGGGFNPAAEDLGDGDHASAASIPDVHVSVINELADCSTLSNISFVSR